jgi:hypothetical protein
MRSRTAAEARIEDGQEASNQGHQATMSIDQKNDGFYIVEFGNGSAPTYAPRRTYGLPSRGLD